MKKINKTSDDFTKDAFCDISWITGFDFHNNSAIAKYFEMAANRLVDSVSKNRKGNSDDGLFIPISYLYRHSAELLLKQLIINSHSADFISNEEIKKLRMGNNHNLYQLLNVGITAIEKRWTDDDKKTLKEVKQIIIDLHNMDPHGQGFRYSHDNNKTASNSRYPKHVNLVEYQELIKKALVFLDACNSEFSQK